ncbi:MAG: hypothetical protein HPY66_1693 [Firmicutes bacterium]|nr:hypothetical protein [Bacillota bacterium]
MDEKIRVVMTKTVRPEFLFLAKPGTAANAGRVYDATTNGNGAISVVSNNGELLGVKPDEFEFVECPDWLLFIHKKRRMEIADDQP